MKRSSKAALLSGLIFPGVGHLFLDAYFRASVLLLLSLAALSAIVTTAYRQARLVVDQIANGDVSMEPGAILQAVSNSSGAVDGLAEKAALIVLVACWLAGIVDSYRLGARQEKLDR